jgi:hypothetical protein
MLTPVLLALVVSLLLVGFLVSLIKARSAVLAADHDLSGWRRRATFASLLICGCCAVALASLIMIGLMRVNLPLRMVVLYSRAFLTASLVSLALAPLSAGLARTIALVDAVIIVSLWFFAIVAMTTP